jgi:hypothetical protein
VDRA